MGSSEWVGWGERSEPQRERRWLGQTPPDVARSTDFLGNPGFHSNPSWIFIFGGRKLPESGSGVGKAISNFKNATHDAQKEIEAAKD